ncbi:MAG: glycoside hydrolase family 25 protein [Lachnospira sp.]|nr:glycoside hydrolase family 25 protein [Lachnospira sp.]
MKGTILTFLKGLKTKLGVNALSHSITSIVGTKVAIASSVVIATSAVAVGGTVAAITIHNESKNAAKAATEVAADVSNGDLLNAVLPYSTDDADIISNEEVYASREEVNDEAILDMISNTSQPVKIINYEDLDIGADDSTNDAPTGEVVEENASNSTNIYETSGIVKGIDVSKWQGDINWSQVAASGVKFAIIKCAGRSTASEGSLYEDSKFEKNIQGAIANGIQVGVYFFSQALTVEEAYEEASMTVQLIRKYQITYPVAFDWESASGYRVEGRLNRQQLTDICNTFASVVSSYGYTPMIYFNRSDWRNAVNTSELTSKYKTWLATYFNAYYYTSTAWDYGNSVPEYPDIPYDIWQYGVTDTVPGINGWCDMDIAFFSYGNYQVQGMQDPYISLKRDSFSLIEGCDLNGNSLPANNDGGDYAAYLRENATGKNCIGYDANLSMVITNSSGNEVDYWTAIHSPGRYTVTYSFVDPRNGYITKAATLVVMTKPTEPETTTESPSETNSEGQSETGSESGSTDVETTSSEDGSTESGSTEANSTEANSTEAGSTEGTSTEGNTSG